MKNTRYEILELLGAMGYCGASENLADRLLEFFDQQCELARVEAYEDGHADGVAEAEADLTNDGYAEGYEDGYAAGYEEGYENGQVFV